MGIFLSMTSVVGRGKEDVETSLRNYAESVGGGLDKQNLPVVDHNCCVVSEANGNTTIFNPYSYTDWDESSEFISHDLGAPVFSFHIHDGDLWMYTLFVKGRVVDQFNPVPDYWKEALGAEQFQSWKGQAHEIAKHLVFVNAADIKNYLVRWDLDAEESDSFKAYPDDEFGQEDWQLLDFMRRLGLPYPLDDDGNAKGETFSLWTRNFPKDFSKPNAAEKLLGKTSDASIKPWWKFW